MKNTTIKLFVLLASSLVMLIIGELVMRASFSEIDYLRPTMIQHDHLRYAIQPSSSGHDEWGFRNTTVPKQADFVAIGDSLTYGVAATAKDSWPAWLARVSKQQVYNLALGGYGLKDYLWLLENKAYLLKPKRVYIALYLGNDFLRSLSKTQGRTPKRRATKASNQRLGKGTRDWLSRNSMLYQIAKLTFSQLSNRIRRYELRQQNRVTIELNTGHINTLLIPRVRVAQQLDTKDHISRSLKDDLETLSKMMRLCDRQPFDCSFVILPTKESVYAEIAQAVLSRQEMSLIKQQLSIENLIYDEVTKFCRDKGYQLIDVLSVMRQAAQSQELYLGNDDGHPSGLGYKVIAEEINRDQVTVSK